MFGEIIVLVFGLIAGFLIMPFVIHYMRKKRVGGTDVHKKEKPFIPEMGGITFLIGVTLSVMLAFVIFPNYGNSLTAFLCSILIAGVIGVIDDMKTLNANVKPFLTLFAGFPLLLLQTYNPYGPVFPLIGQTRLTMIYPILIPFALAITSNSVNMMDPFNGTMSGTCTIISVVLLVSGMILGSSNAILLCICVVGPLLVLYYYNRYPAKVFSGDTGSLAIGASLGAIAIIGKIEVVAIIAFAAQIMNGFYGLSTIGRLYERREVERPVIVLEDGRLKATTSSKAPITLARVILARGPLHEYEASRIFLILSSISGLLAIGTALLTVVTA